MKIHEYQAKELMRKFSVPLPQGDVAFTPSEAREVAEKLQSQAFAVKAQIHAGGRGKGGGVKIAKSPQEVEKAASEILGMTLVTPQTGPEGKVVRKVLVEEVVEIEQELYLGITIDRSIACPVIMMSAAGGMEIEEIAARSPEMIKKEAVNPITGLVPFQIRNLVFGLGLDPSMVKTCSTFLVPLYRLFTEYDCSLVEINPLVITSDKRMIALDAKINFDDNALYRHSDLTDLRDPDEEDPLEREASKYKLNYIRLEGNVGAMVNGAGLAMATMDLIKNAGAEPANFLDVGGGANAEMITNGFRIILSDSRVKAILINIFGGILRCDTLAEGVIEAAKNVEIKVPLIVRLEGTNVEKGRSMLRESGIDFKVARNIREAAQLVAQSVK
nr:ADP-forming succinate--CoA ligase subunit beta [Desulfobacterales bacterium]